MRRHAKAIVALAVFCATLALGVGLASATPPVVVIGTATSPSYTSVQVTGEVDPQGEQVEWFFQVSSDGGSSWERSTLAGNAEGSGLQPVGGTIEGLRPDTPYLVRLAAFNFTEFTEVDSAEPSPGFTTLAVAPAHVEIDPVTTFTATTAHFSGHINPEAPGGDPEAFGVSWHFRYSDDGGATWLSTPGGSVPAGDSSVPVEVDAAELHPHKAYEVELVAENAGGPASAGPSSFTTLAVAPVVTPAVYTPDPGSPDTTVLVRGYVDPLNSAVTACSFQYGPSDAYGQSAPCEGDPNGPGPFEPEPPALVSAKLAGLAAGATYHYRLLATSAAGTTATDDQAFTVPAAPSTAPCPNAARRAEQGSALPDCRAWEMVSPPDKNGGGVTPSSVRSDAAAEGSATTFASLSAFADAQGTGVSTEYMAQRSGAPGTQGWATHAITPPQEPLSSFVLTAGTGDQRYQEFSPDLSTGIFRAWSPLTDDPDVADVVNLYVRRDLRDAGRGSYSLATACPACTAPLAWHGLAKENPFFAAATPDFSHVLFESIQNYTGNGSGVPKLYASDDGRVRLVGLVPSGTATTCGGAAPACVLPAKGSGASIAGTGAVRNHYLPHVISDDGRYASFAAPVTAEGTLVTGGAAANRSKLYQRDSQGTADPADDTTTLIDASERTVPAQSQAAIYQTASTDGSRVFFTTQEPLTDDTPNISTVEHLYMWDRDVANDETQRLTVAASSGTYTLTFAGQATAPIAAAATPAQLEAALDALSTVGGAGGSVAVKGGPGDASGSRPYYVTFEGSLAEADQPLMSSDSSLLGGGTATVEPWVKGGGHLTFLSADDEPADDGANVQGVIGASEDGRWVYFVAQGGQIVKGAPRLSGVNRRGIYLWHDGEVRYIGNFVNADSNSILEDIPSSGLTWSSGELTSRVSPDGRDLLFVARDGSGLTGYDQNTIGCGLGGGEGCTEFYLYDAAGSGSLVCATCNPGAVKATADASISVNTDNGAMAPTSHLSHALSDDGSRVFFTSGEALVPEDTDGTKDAYEYDAATGAVALLSSGRSPFNSWFMDASDDGSDAFFLTRERLAGWDVDEANDLYDARAGGGFPEPPATAAPCAGEGCRGSAAGAPGAASPGSSLLSAPPNRPIADCAAPARRAKAQRGHARRLAARAKALRRRAGRGHQARRARKLSGRARASAGRAHKLSRQVKSCRRANRKAAGR